MKCSVLLITFNHAKYIELAIDSILMQETNVEYELICLDDASNDGTFEIAKAKLSNAKNATIVQNDGNLGITKNYQKGFALCKGEFVFVLEGDDYWLDSRKMQKQMDFLQTHPFHSMCYHPFYVQKDDTSIFENTYSDHDGHVATGSISIQDLLLNEGLIANFSVCCYRRSLIEKLPHELYNHVSYDWIINMFMGHFGLIGRLAEKMSVYRHVENATWSSRPYTELLSKTKELIPVYDKLLEYRYTKFFQIKSGLLQQQINGLQQRTHIKDFIPRIVIIATKMILPPILIKRFKR